MKSGDTEFLSKLKKIHSKLDHFQERVSAPPLHTITKGRPIPENMYRHKLPMTLAELEIVSEDARKISPFHQKRLELDSSSSINLPAETIERQRQLYKEGRMKE